MSEDLSELPPNTICFIVPWALWRGPGERPHECIIDRRLTPGEPLYNVYLKLRCVAGEHDYAVTFHDGEPGRVPRKYLIPKWDRDDAAHDLTTRPVDDLVCI